LTLARRGEKNSLPRAIEAIRIAAVPQMAGVPHENIQKRVLVLVSNIARQNNIAAPTIKWGYEPDNAAIYQELTTWLAKHEAEITTVEDPWIKELAQQRID